MAKKLNWKGLIVVTQDALMKHDTVILQSCTIVPSSASSIKVEEVEVSGLSITVQIPEPISFPSFKTETDEVSHLPVCPLLDTCHRYP